MPLKMHPRVVLVSKAHNDIEKAVLDAMGNHPDLTYVELLSIFNQISASWIKLAIRAERHPDDPDKPGGLE